MSQVVIENPVINLPFDEPQRHFRFTEEGITDEVVETRRVSQYFIPIPRPRKRNAKQLSFETEWTADRIQENEFINKVRGRVALWRQGGYVGVTSATRRLLDYWKNPERERRLFFCQVEAMETAIYLTEVARKFGDAWIENALRDANAEAQGRASGSPLHRIAFKMATGSGKTAVMAMLIAWHALNKLADPQNALFGDAFLVVAPGLTIRDRLRVLLPSDPQNYYRTLDLVPPDLRDELGKIKIVITNFHAFKLRERLNAGKLTKSLLAQGEASPFTESPDQMVRRACRELGNKKNLIVLNDEAHHCYRRKPEEEAAEAERLAGDERKEAEHRNEEARVWISGLEAVKAKLGVRVVYDLSATPFFLRGSGYNEGTLFPWVVSDFSLIDAIESGIVKVPRVPVADDRMTGPDGQPTYRDLWLNIRDHLPRKGRGTDSVTGEPNLPKELEGALQSLYANYEKYYGLWEQNAEARSKGLTPPVFIVVCNNTNVSKLVFDYIGGWEKTLTPALPAPLRFGGQVSHRERETVLVPGKLALFSNVVGEQWAARPNTILVDSEQLESGEGMSDDFKRIAAVEIEEFKAEYRARFPGRDADALTDEDILREVMNTVGKSGKLGEGVKCVVSVSMLTEGWDANTVTHVLGVRAFGTQLLCEQVVGRGLRRMGYAVNAQGQFDPEYAEVYGVPFSFIPSAGSQANPRPGPTPTRVRALEDRAACEITFPRVMGYRYDLPSERLTATFDARAKLALSTADVPTKTEMSSIIGESNYHTLYGLREKREQMVAFRLASLTLEKYFKDDAGNLKPWLFPQLLGITRRWLAECVVCKDNAFPQMLLITEFAHDAADKIYHAIVTSAGGEKRLKPILRPYDTLGSTRYVDFDTTRAVYSTNPAYCHISHVVLDSNWEAKMAQALEEMEEVVCYVKNQGLGFTIPYTLNGEEHGYLPDYLVRVNLPSPDGAVPVGRGAGGEGLLNLILEVSGEARRDKAAKVAAARDLWVPAINNHGGYGRWAFIEISDPWDAKNTIRAMLGSARTLL
jgi:type III restriction enzyme